MDLEELKKIYPNILRKYLFEGKEEEALDTANELAKECFEAQISMEDIIALHTSSLEELIKELSPSRAPEIMLKSSNLLLEFAIRFSLTCQNYSEMLKRTDEKIHKAFYQAGEALTAGLDIQKVLSAILGLVKNLIDAKACSIMLWEDGRFVTKAEEGLEEGWIPDIEGLLAYRVMEEGVPKFIPDTKDQKIGLPRLKKGGMIRSLISLPVQAKGKFLGVIEIYLAEPHVFEEGEVELFMSFARQAGAAIDNFRLFSELQQRVRTIEGLYDIDRVVSGSLDLEEVLRAALNKAIEVVEADSGSLHLLDEKGENLILKIYRGLSPEFVSMISKLKMGEGVSGRAAAVMKPVTLDISHYPSPELLPNLEKEGIVSLASTPLIAKGRVLGAMTFTNRKYRIFSQDDLDLLASIGSQIGVAIENARLFSELQRHEKTLETLYAIDRVVSQTLDLDTIFKDALSKALEVTETDSGGIYLLEEDGETLGLKVQLGLSEELARAASKLKVGEGVSGMAVKSGKPVSLDIAKYPGEYPGPDLLSHLVKDRIVSIASSPLIAKGKVIGAMTLNRRQRSFSQGDLDILASIGSQIAVAVENASLFSELQRHEKTLEALYAIDRVVSQTLDLDTIFRDALSKAVEVTETEAGGIYLLEEDGETLNLKAHIGISQETVSTLSKIKVGQGVSGTAVKSGKPVTLDIEKYPSPELVAPLIKEGIFSIAGVPLIVKEKIVGALSLSNRRRRSFSKDDLDLLASIGSQIGVAIENSRLFSELERHHNTLKALYAIESVVSRSLNLEEIFNVALSKALEITDTEAGTLYSLEGEVLRLEAFKGLSPEFKEKALIREMGEGIPGIAAQHKKAITMDISQYPSPHLLPYVTKEGLVSFIGTPLMSKGKVVGALALGTKKKRIFTQDDLDLLFSIGNAIGVALENARLYQEVKDKAEYINSLYKIAQATKASLDIGEVFETMVVGMKRTLTFDRTSINLLEDEIIEVFALAEDIKIPELGRGTRISRDKSSCGLILDRGVGLIRSLDKETPFLEDTILFKKGIRTIIQVPLISKGEMIGVFCLESSKPEAYNQRDLGLAQSIADQIATSIENARLYEDLKQTKLELEKRLKELEEFYEMAVGRELRMIELKEKIRSLE